MVYLQLTYWHLGTIAPASVLGTYLLLNQKGTSQHRLLDKVYMSLMLVTAFVTLFMSAKVGPTLFNHFGAIHLLSVLVFYTVPSAYIATRNGNVIKHKENDRFVRRRIVNRRGFYFNARAATSLLVIWLR